MILVEFITTLMKKSSLNKLKMKKEKWVEFCSEY